MKCLLIDRPTVSYFMHHQIIKYAIIILLNDNYITMSLLDHLHMVLYLHSVIRYSLYTSDGTSNHNRNRKTTTTAKQRIKTHKRKTATAYRCAFQNRNNRLRVWHESRAVAVEGIKLFQNNIVKHQSARCMEQM